MVKQSTSSRDSDHFGVHPSVSYIQSIVSNLATKTGRSLEAWAALTAQEGPVDEKSRRLWLKTAHGLGGTTVALIINQINGSAGELYDPAAYLAAAPTYVARMFSGAKAGLKPIYDSLIDLSLSFGPDVKVCPCKTIVPLYRTHVFAEIKPATRTRVDLGLALKAAGGEELPQRLLPTGGLEKGDRITHRIPLGGVEEVDDEVRHWLRRAYHFDA